MAGSRRVRIGIVAGEASGDLIGSHLVEGVRRLLPEAEFVGIGGPRMQAAGVESLFPMDKLSVRGFVEVLDNFRAILAIRRALIRGFLAQPPDLYVGVDAPDFNLGVEARLRAAGIPTVQYVGPAVWAWGLHRVEKVRRAAERVLAIFPFEPAIYERAGVPVTYVGHPLADMIPEHPDRDAAREQMRLPPGAPVVALLPGSRRAELKYMADLFVRTARLLAERLPGVRFLVPLVTRETRAMFEDALFRNHAADLPVKLLFGHAQDAMTAADGVIVASGTATLEAALLKRPMVITYKLAPLTWWISRRKAYTPWVGLPNILAGEGLVPEFLQDDATPENLAAALVSIMSDRRRVRRLEERFAEIHQLLRRNTAEQAALAVLPLLESRIADRASRTGT
jgi:lipid-A-disaccharide synthase